MALQTLKASKTPLYIVNAPFLPKGTRKIFRDEIAKVIAAGLDWHEPDSDNLYYVFSWRCTPQGHRYWSTWSLYLQEERRKAGHRV